MFGKMQYDARKNKPILSAIEAISEVFAIKNFFTLYINNFFIFINTLMYYLQINSENH